MPFFIHIAPQLSPVICGVGDYAALVGTKMEESRPDVRCGYVACGHHKTSDVVSGEGRIDARGVTGANAFWGAVRACIDDLAAHEDDVALVLNYVGYGYAPNGAPEWLASALERRPDWFRNGRVITMFHELYANGWPWQRAFWQSPKQRSVAARIARASDGLMTNRAASARWLERATGRPAGAVPSLPVPSNVGEPEEVPTWSSRAASAILFGGARFKRPFLAGKEAWATADFCRMIGIDLVYDVGQMSRIDDAAFRSRAIRIIQTGTLPADEVTKRFIDSRVAFVDYYSGYYGKSGVLAAAAAHGTSPIFLKPGEATDGLRFGEHLWDLRSAISVAPEFASEMLSTMSRSIRAWYDGHGIYRHARKLLELACAEPVSVR
jgi:hypothetical protein